jgi:hypothetical protein
MGVNDSSFIEISVDEIKTDCVNAVCFVLDMTNFLFEILRLPILMLYCYLFFPVLFINLVF